MLDDGGYLAYKERLGKKAKKNKKDNKSKKKAKVKKIKTKGKSQAKKVAEKTLKESLKQEYSISLTVDGNVGYCAGAIIELDESFGRFEGKYIIDKVTHKIDGDYSCDIEAFRLGARENAINSAKEKTKAEMIKKEKAKAKTKHKFKKVVNKNDGHNKAGRNK